MQEIVYIERVPGTMEPETAATLRSFDPLAGYWDVIAIAIIPLIIGIIGVINAL